MNILLYVLTMIMLLALLTYAKIDSHRQLSSLQAQFQTYMAHIERKHISQQAQNLYDKTHISSRNGSNPKPKNESTPRLNWQVIVKKEERDQNPNLYENMVNWSKKLIYLLYGDQLFFKQALEKNHHLLEDIFAAIEKAVDALPEDKKPNKASDLANLDLVDILLNQSFYKMLKGNLIPTQPVLKTTKRAFIPFEDRVEEEIANAENEVPDLDESQADEGYISLLDFITLNTKKKIRVYLAHHTLLLAILGDEGIVKDVEEKRYQIYQALLRGADNEEATAEFDSFMKHRIANYDPNLFDFSVSKTNPKTYEKMATTQ